MTERAARRPTIADVAQASGTHDSTASRVLNRGDFGTPELRARVLSAAAALGYRPNRRAQGLRRDRSWTIGLLVSDLGNAAFLPFIRGAQHAADAHGYALLVGDGQRSRAVETRVLERFFDQGVDALVIAGPYRAAETARLFVDHGIPIAPLAGTVSEDWRAQRVRQEAAATAEAVGCLADHGHRSLLFASARFGEPVAGEDYRRARRVPARDAARARGMSIAELGVDAADVVGEATSHLRRLVDDGAMPTAVVSGSHAAAPGLLRAIRASGLSVPDDVSFVTYGDSEWALAHMPTLSVIRRDFHAEATYLVGGVLAAIDPSLPTPVDPALDARFVRRESIGAAP